MKAKITKIHEGKISRNNDSIYYRIRMEIFDENFKSIGYAMTDVVPTYRNFAWWKDAIKSGIGTWISNVSFKKMPQDKKIGKVDADSQIRIINPPAELQGEVDSGKEIKPNELSVKSKSDPEKEYKIVRTDTGWECSCPAFEFSKAVPKICKHIQEKLGQRSLL